MPYLTLLADDNTEGPKIPILSGAPFTIGRGASASCRIRDKKMSRVHCELSVSGDVTVIADLGSMNGTYVNGRRIASTALSDGDVIQVGYTRFRYHDGEPAEPSRREPPAQRAAASKPPPLSERRPAPKPGAPQAPRPATSATRPARTPPDPAPRRATKETRTPPASAAAPRRAPDDATVVAALHIVLRPRPRALKKGEALCATCGGPATARELKSGAATDVHGQICCPRCIQADPLLGRTVGGYRIDAKLGASPWSATYKAEQLSMERPVVLRVIDPRLVRDPELAAQFLAALKRGGQISHPNLVRIYDVGRTEEFCYICVEFIDGENLARRLSRKDAFPPAAAVDLVSQVAGAIDVAHRRGVYHRDIRPSNIVLNDEGIPKLVGLGLAKSIEETAAAGRLRLEHAPEFIRYWPPECVLDPAHVSARADLYALGAVLYAILAGRPPFDADDPVELVRAIRRVRPKPLDAVRKDVPRRLSAVVAKAMAKSPADRYADCRRFIEALRTALR